MSKIDYDKIDIEMRPIIKLLNSKGWKTTSCCQGHWKEDLKCYCGSFICFGVDVPKEYFPMLKGFPFKDDGKYISKCKFPITIVGSGYKNKITEMKNNNVFYWQHTKYKRTSREEKDKEHELFLKELYKWAENLPMYDEIEKWGKIYEKLGAVMGT